MIFYVKLQGNRYLRLEAPDRRTALDMAPQGHLAIYSEAYFYEVERKRYKCKVVGNPCIDCTMRHEACHATCKDYICWKHLRDEKNDAIIKAKR